MRVQKRLKKIIREVKEQQLLRKKTPHRRRKALVLISTPTL